MTAELRTHLWVITSVGAPCRDDYCTGTEDSRKLVVKWKTQFDFHSVKLIDLNCEGVYERMGYFPSRTMQSLLSVTVLYFDDSSNISGLWS